MDVCFQTLEVLHFISFDLFILYIIPGGGVSSLLKLVVLAGFKVLTLSIEPHVFHMGAPKEGRVMEASRKQGRTRFLS